MYVKKPGKGEKDTSNEEPLNDRTDYKSNVSKTRDYVDDDQYTYQSGYRENVYMDSGDNLYKSLSPNQEARVIETPGNITTIKVNLPKRDVQGSPERSRMSPNRNQYGSPMSPNSQRVAKPVACEIMFRTLMKHRMELLIGKIRRTPNNELKMNILKRLIRGKLNVDEMKIRTTLKLWRTLAFNMAMNGDKTKSAIPKILNKFACGWQKKFLAKYFSLWSRKCLSKPNQELVSYFKGFDSLHTYARKAVFKLTMPIKSTKGIQNKLLMGVGLTAGKCRLLTLRNFLNKWRTYVVKCHEDNFKLALLKNLGGSIFRKFYARALMKYMQRWRRIVQWFSLNELIGSSDMESRRIKAGNLLNSGTTKLARRIALQGILDPLNKHYDDLVRQQAARKVIGLFPKLNKILLRSWWNKYKDLMKKFQLKDARNSIFVSMAKGSFAKMRMKILGKYFGKWSRFTSKGGEKLGKVLAGYDKFRNYCQRQNYNDAVSAMTRGYNNKYTYNLLFKCVGLNDKFLQRHFRQFLLRWRKICYLLALRENGQSLSFKIMSTMSDKIKKRFLTKAFNRWKALLKIDIEALFERYRLIGERMKKIQNKVLEKPKQDFLANINKFKSNRAVAKAIRVLSNIAINGLAYKLKLFLAKWRIQARAITNYNNLLKVFRGNIMGHEILTAKQLKARALYKWRQVVFGNNIINTSKGLNILDELPRSRKVAFMSQLRSATRIIKNVILADGRGNLLKNLRKRAQLGDLSHYLKKWKHINDTLAKKEKNKAKGEKKLGSKVQSGFKRADNSKIQKFFNKWRLKAKKPPTYFLMMNSFFDILNKNLRKAYLRDAFYAILDTKNYKKLFEKMLPINSKLLARRNKAALQKALNKLKDNAKNGRLDDMRNALFGKLGGIFKSKFKGMLTRCFYKWRRIALNKYDIKNMMNGWNKLLNHSRKQHKPDIVNAAIKNYWEKMKTKGLNALFGNCDSYWKKKSQIALNKWARIAFWMKNKEILAGKTLRSLKLIILKNWVWGPLENSFNKWRRLAAVKPDKTKFAKAMNNLEKAVQKKHAPKLMKAMSDNFWKKAQDNMLLKLLPNRQKYLHHYLNLFLHRWKKNCGLMQMKGLHFKLLSGLFEKGRKNFFQKLLQTYFKKWAYRKFPYDLTAAVNGEKALFGFFARKYLQGFFTDMKNYGKYRFLRSLLMRTSKYHQRNLGDFWRRWFARVVRYREIGLQGMLLGRTCKLRLNKMYRDILAKRFGQLRSWAHAMAKFGHILPEAKKQIQKHAMKGLEPALKAFKQYKAQQKGLTKMGNTVMKTLMKKLFVAFMRWRHKLRLFGVEDMQSLLKQKVLRGLFNKTPKLMLLRWFIHWRSIRIQPIRATYFKMACDQIRHHVLKQNWPMFKKFTLKKCLLHRMTLLGLRLVGRYQDHLKNAFLFWLADTRHHLKHKNAKIIQNFLKSKKDRLMQDAKDKKNVDIIEKIGEIIKKAANKKTMDDMKDMNKKKGLENLAKALDNKRKKNLLGVKDSLKKYGDELHGDKDRLAKKLQAIYRAHKSRTGIWGLIMKIRKLRLILAMMGNKKLRYMYVAFKLWDRVANRDKLNDKARIIQKFLRGGVMNQLASRTKEICLLWKMLAKRLWMNTCIGRFQLCKYFGRFNKFAWLIKKHYWNHLYNQIYLREKMRFLSRLFQIPQNLRVKYLAFWFPKWRNIAQKLGDDQTRKERMNDLLFKIWGKYIGKFEDMRSFYLRLWLRNARKLKIEHAGNVITKFVRDKWNLIKARRMWQRMSYGLLLLQGKLSGFEIIRRFRFLKGTQALQRFALIKEKSHWEEFKNKVKHWRVVKLLWLLFVNYENRQSVLLKRLGWRRYRHYVGKMKAIEDGLEKMVKVVDYRRHVIGAEYVNAAMVIKRFLRWLAFARLRSAFNSIKDKSDGYLRVKDKINVINKCKDSLMVHNADVFAKRLYKLYVYKVLEKMNHFIDDYYRNTLGKHFGRVFMDGLRDKFDESNQYKDGKQQNFQNKPPQPQKFTKKLETKNPKKVQNANIKKKPHKYVMPHLVKLLEGIKNKKMIDAFNAIKDEARCQYLADSLDKYGQKKEKGFFGLFLSSLNNYYQFQIQKPQYMQKLKGLFRRGFILQFKDSLLACRKVYRLSYLVKLSMMHKEVAKARYVKEIMAKWRFIILMKTLTNRKINEFRRNVDVMFNDMFGKDENLLLDEVEDIGNLAGYFKNEDRGFYDFMKKKHYISKNNKYKFDLASIGKWYEEYKVELEIINYDVPLFQSKQSGSQKKITTPKNK